MRSQLSHGKFSCWVMRSKAYGACSTALWSGSNKRLQKGNVRCADKVSYPLKLRRYMLTQLEFEWKDTGVLQQEAASNE